MLKRAEAKTGGRARLLVADTTALPFETGTFDAALIHVDADIFLADEVLAVGDRPFKRKCLKKMQEIRAEGTTIFYVSHATASVRSMCDRVLVLESGRLMYDSKTTPDGSVDGAIRFLHYDDETDDEEHADEELGSEV